MGEDPKLASSSLAGRIYEDLARHNPNAPEPTTSLIYTGLRDALIKEAEAYEAKAASSIEAAHAERFAWLEER